MIFEFKSLSLYLELEFGIFQIEDTELCIVRNKTTHYARIYNVLCCVIFDYELELPEIPLNTTHKPNSICIIPEE